MKETYIHIGLPKTATTYLQTSVFPYLKENINFNPQELSAFYRVINKLNSEYDFLISPQEDREIKQGINELKKCNQSILISHEAISAKGYSLNYKEGLAVIKKYFPTSKIILILRNPEDWVISMYRQSIQQGNIQTFRSFVSPNSEQNRLFNTYQTGILPTLSLTSIKYEQLVRDYIETFSEESTHILTYEMLRENKQAFLGRFGDILNTSTLSEKDGISLNLGKNVVYRSLSGLSILISIVLFKLLSPVKKQLKYNKDLKLFNQRDNNSSQSLFHNPNFHWIKIRKLFKEKIDAKYYLDLGMQKRYQRYLRSFGNVLENSKKTWEKYNR